MMKEENVLSKSINCYEALKKSSLYETLSLEEEYQLIENLDEKVKLNKFKIAIIGEFSVGKSSIINTFLQQEILPAKYRPTTNQLTIINHNPVFYVREEDKLETTEELTKENVRTLNKTAQGNIEIGTKLPHLSDYQIIDTPGVNDPSMFTDEIVFDLIGSVDIVLFVMHASQIFKKSEMTFLTKLIRKKDIGKFFFIINQSDLVVGEKQEVYDDFIDKASSYMHLNPSKLKKQTFLYSSKDVLNAIVSKDEKALKESNYFNLIEGIDNYIKENKAELIEEQIKKELSDITTLSLMKLNTAIDIINDKDLEYEQTIKELQVEIEAFQKEIEQSSKKFTEEFNAKKGDLEKKLKSSFVDIKNEMREEISQKSIRELTQGRYIEIRTKKLIEDATDSHMAYFLEQLQATFQNLETNIKPIYDEKTVVIDNLIHKNISSKVVNGIAIAATAGTAIAMTPTILTVGTVAVALNVVASMTGFAGGVLLSGVLTTAATFVGGVAKIAWGLGKWGVQGVSTVAGRYEESFIRERYLSSVEESISTIEKKILRDINDNYKSQNFLDSYIHEKFPQMDELSQRNAQAKREFRTKIKEGIHSQIELEKIKLELEKLV